MGTCILTCVQNMLLLICQQAQSKVKGASQTCSLNSLSDFAFCPKLSFPMILGVKPYKNKTQVKCHLQKKAFKMILKQFIRKM